MTKEQRLIAKIIATSWIDPAFRTRFVTDPATVLREQGVKLPMDVIVRVHEAREGERHIVLPPLPRGLKPRDVKGEAVVPIYTHYGTSAPKGPPAKRAAKKGGRKGGKKGGRKAGGRRKKR